MLCWSVRVLLLGLLLLTVTALDSEERKKEKEADNFSATAGRGAPQNLKAEAVSSTAVYVSWDPPDDPPTKYTVLTEGDPSDTTNTFYQIDGLSVCTSYLITVTSVYDDSEQHPAVTSATTDSTVPPPPQNCEFSRITETWIDVKWTDPVSECRITDHLISWSWDVLWSDEQGSNETFSDKNKIRLTDFKPYTNVTVNVEAGTSAGYGAPTTCWNVTLQDVPGAPVITSIEYSEHLLYITWSPPEEANGVILRYLVDIVDNGHHTREYVTETEDVISDLPECTSYDITVTAETEPGSGPSSAANSTFLSGSVAPSFVTCDLGDNDNARVCWKPCSEECFIGDLNYNISWSSDVLWSDTEDSGEDSWPWENMDNSCYTLDSSVPYTNYSFCVGVVDQDIDAECCSVATPQTAPGPPININVTSSDGSAYVTWTPPEEANGEISNYEVNFVTETDFNNITVSGIETEVNIPGLQVCEIYNFTVKAKTDVENWGPESDTISCLIDGVVTPTISNCSLEDDSINVCWTPSPAECPMPGYTVTWDGAKMWTDNSDHEFNSTYQDWQNDIWLCDMLESSVPYTNYNVCVSVTNTRGYSECCSLETPETTPGPPVINQVESNRTSIYVSWDHPVNENGKIQNYQITWENKDGYTESKTLDNKTRSTTIQNLSPCQNYVISLKAETSAGVGEEVQTNTFLPNYIADDSLKCSGDDTVQANLEWSLEVPDCQVSTEYILDWSATVLWSQENLGDVVTITEDTTSYVLSGLKPYTEFTVCLKVVDDTGDPSCCTSTTQQDQASKPINLKLEDETSTQASISWSPPTNINGELQNWHITWNNSDSTNQTDIASVYYKYNITRLQPCTDYTIDVKARNGAGLGAPATIPVTTDCPKSKPPVGAIVGGTVGGVCLLLLLVAGGVLYSRRWKDNASSHSDGSVEMSSKDNYNTRRESQAIIGNMEMRKASLVAGGVNGLKRNQLEERRGSEVHPRVNNGMQRRGSEDPGRVNSRMQRRSSEVPGRVNSRMQRRASEDPQRFAERFNGMQRRASEVPFRPASDERKPPMLRRASEVPFRPASDDRKPPMLRRASDFPIRFNSESQHAHLQRRASEVPSRMTGGNINVPPQRRASEAPFRATGGNINAPPQRRASEVPTGFNRENNNYLLQRRASEAPFRVTGGNINAPPQRRASEAPYRATGGNINVPPQRRASEVPGGPLSRTNNYPGLRRASERF